MILTCAAAAMLFAAPFFSWPYGYYMILRWVVAFTAGWLLALVWATPTNWKWIFGVIAVAFNPIVPIYLSRSVWAVLDVAAALLLLMSMRPIAATLHKVPHFEDANAQPDPAVESPPQHSTKESP